MSKPPIREGKPTLGNLIAEECAALRSRITALEAELDAEKAKVAKLREALLPFAETTDFRALSLTCTQSDIRRARRIHEETA